MTGLLNRGAWGETLAAKDYKKSGYTLVEKNYSSRFGEIDLILKKENHYIFTEVKTRNNKALGAPREWVDTPKQRRIIKTALMYIQEHRLDDAFMRFDVVEVYWSKMGPPKILRIENAFTA